MAKYIKMFLILFMIFTIISTCLSSNDLSPNYVCDPSWFARLGLDMSHFAFCDIDTPYDYRVRDLVSRMTLHEKVQQLGDIAYGVPRLGLPQYSWWSEALHGVSNVGRHGTFFDSIVPNATSFPTVILTAASFDETLWKKIGQVVSTEARAMYNLGRAGLTFWSPNINVVRDPRWGRILETPGEDPFVVGKYASNYVRGLQDVEGSTDNQTDLNTRPLKVSSCCKHYAAYDVDNWHGFVRETFDAIVTEQDMIETFLLPFEMCVKEGDVSSVMCSYNRVNGIPTCADPKLLNQTIRGDWDLHGYIVSDCDSIEVIVNRHKYLNATPEEAVALTMKAGLDLDCGDYYTNFTENVVQQGKIREEQIDKSLNNLYFVLMRLGYFDGIPQYQSFGKNDICSNSSLLLAKEAAKQGIVLLKNDNNILPFNLSANNNLHNVALVGPHANATYAMIGNYAGIPCRFRTPVDGFSGYVNVSYALGCDVACRNESFFAPAIEAARNADATVIVAGLDLSVEAEGLDRNDLLLPGYQTRFINEVANSSKGPVILVIMSAGGLDISFAKNNVNIKGILWAGYLGQEGGEAIADVVFGQYNPGGRLPITWFEADYIDRVPMTSMQLRPQPDLGYPGRTYKFFNGSTVYPFGFGLSYTKFHYELTTISLNQTATPFVEESINTFDIVLDRYEHCWDIMYTNQTLKPQCPAIRTQDLHCEVYKFGFEVEVQNVGSLDGTETVIIYSVPPEGISGSYIKKVIGFKKAYINAGSSQKFQFEFDLCKSLEIVDYNAYTLLPSGIYTIIIGDSGVSFSLQVKYHLSSSSSSSSSKRIKI